MSGRQLRRGRGRGKTVGGSGEGSEEVVEEGREKRRKKTEGRPPSDLIKFITSSLDLARDSPPPLLLLPLLVPLASRRIRITVPFFPFAAPRLTTVRTPRVPSPPASSRSAPLRSFIYAYFDPSTCRLRGSLVGNHFFLRPLPCSPSFFFSFFIPSWHHPSRLVPTSPGHSRSHSPQVR